MVTVMVGPEAGPLPAVSDAAAASARSLVVSSAAKIQNT